ncbi:MAG: leucine-rich repeat domain-containing protein [Butyrivibrio sp.]|nr:leucine-rich repeat domain-containing protein [Butyrivibrio sp.]
MNIRKTLNTVIIGIICLFMAISVLNIPIKTEAASKVVKVSTLKKGTTFKSGNLNYRVTKYSKGKGTVTVTGLIKNNKKITIPDSVKVSCKVDGKVIVVTMKVSSVAKNAFIANYDLKNVKLGKNVEVINSGAFCNCPYLETVTVKKGSALKKINKNAFANDYSLTTFNFNLLKKLEVVNDEAFYMCYRLKNDIPKEKMSSVIKLAKNASKYKYIVEPLVAPFNDYFYVRTNNKNIKTVRFIDKKCKKAIKYDNNTMNLCQETYIDVKYENATKYKVKGGYIFKSGNSDSVIDGGTFCLQVFSDKYGWVDTNVLIDAPAVTDAASYMVDKYAVYGNDFEKNMEAVSSALQGYGFDYLNIYDSNAYSKNGVKYPYLYTSYYGINRVTSGIYKNISGVLLAYNSYPFKASNLSSILYEVALKLDPKCKISEGYSSISVTHNGKSTSYSFRSYSGDSNIVYKKNVEKSYRFDGTDTDSAGIYSLENVKTRLNRYVTKSTKDSEALSESLNKKYNYSVIKNSAWIRINGGSYTYSTQGAWYLDGHYGYKEYSDAWVDGRYVNDKCVFERGAKFSQHPTSRIIIRNKTYINYSGKKVTGDLEYVYDKNTGTWKSEDYLILSYAVGQWTSTILKEGDELPEEFILTQEEAAKLGVDKNTNLNPAHGFIFDGTVAPGTSF